MSTFLDHIAQELLLAYPNDLADITVVLPGRRAGVYLRKRLAVLKGSPIVAPVSFTFPEWIQSVSGKVVAGKLEQSFMLYDAYLDVLGSKAESFSSFARWSGTVLSDLSDIDQYLGSHQNIFRDLRDVREIENWSFNESPLTQAQKNYLAFWNELKEITEKFNLLQESQQRFSYARIVRLSAENGVVLSANTKSIWFVGLSTLSKAEQKIVDDLASAGKTVCRWDADNFYVNNPRHEAGAFMRTRPKEELVVPVHGLDEGRKAFSVFQCVTSYSETLALISHLQKLSVDDLQKSVVVLANEKAIFTLMSRLPQLAVPVNVAMGVSLKHSSIFKLLKSIIHLHQSAERTHPVSFYFKNVLDVLSQPSLQLLLRNESSLMREQLFLHKRIFIHPAAWSEMTKDLSQIKVLDFLFVEECNTSNGLIARLKKVCDILIELDGISDFELETILRSRDLLDEISVPITSKNYLQDIDALDVLFHHLVGKETVTFEGEPFQGLQVLGMVETRAIDFDNVFIVGANEDVFPGNLHEPSLIPWDLRRLHRMPTIADKEAMYSYSFYRLLQRAKDIRFYYSSITSDFKGTEQSRYITQIEVELLNRNKNSSMVRSQIELPTASIVRSEDFVLNTEWARNRLKQLLERGISPSAINRFLNCPLDFYYRYIIGLGEREGMEEVMDVTTFGTIIHDVLENFYKNYLNSYPEVDDFVKLNTNIDEVLDEAISKYYSVNVMSEGFNYLMRLVAKSMIKRTLKNESDDLQNDLNEGVQPKILFLEESLKREIDGSKYNWPFNVFIQGKADRIDEVLGRTRIIDYKTGKVEAKDVRWKEESVFSAKHPKLLQLISYVFMYCANGKSPSNVSAELRSLRSHGSGPFKLHKEDESPFSQEDMERFESGIMGLVKEMWTTEKFLHEDSSHTCEYCRTV